jgi:hypothetical protein
MSQPIAPGNELSGESVMMLKELSDVIRVAVVPVASALLIASGIYATTVHAEGLGDRIVLHGFGYQNYMQTDKNTYIDADKRGTWDNNFLGLVTSIDINDRSKLWAQVEGSTTDGTRFTWFFVDYQFTENLRGHVGRVKFPLGLYNETIDAKFLQVAQLEPSLYQGAADMVHDSYHGAGIDYEQDVGHGHIVWQVYGGNSYDLDPPVDSRDRRIVGGRVTYRTPLSDLRFMVSSYRTQVELLADHTMHNEDRGIFSVDYSGDICDIKAEYAVHQFFGVTSNAYYVQGRYSLTDKFSPYVRYDYANTNKDLRDDPSYYQKTFVIGLQYRVAENITLRVENHFNHGYGLPVASGEITAGTGADNWSLAVAGINFSF